MFKLVQQLSKMPSCIKSGNIRVQGINKTIWSWKSSRQLGIIDIAGKFVSKFGSCWQWLGVDGMERQCIAQYKQTSAHCKQDQAQLVVSVETASTNPDHLNMGWVWDHPTHILGPWSRRLYWYWYATIWTQRTVAGWFAAVRQVRVVRRSLPSIVLQTLVTSFVSTLLIYDNTTLAGIPAKPLLVRLIPFRLITWPEQPRHMNEKF